MTTKTLKEYIKEYVEANMGSCTARSKCRKTGLHFGNNEFNSLWKAAGGRTRAKTIPATSLADNGEEAAQAAPQPKVAGKVHSPDHYRRTLEGTRFVFTYAQNNTYIHEDFWSSLLHYCKVNSAQLGVAKGTYNIGAWRDLGGVELEHEGDTGSSIWYDERIEPYAINENTQVCKDLIFCGELDINPTAVNPLSGLDDYTGPKSGIVPHTKVLLKSLATMKNHDTKFLTTTGAITLRNYINRKTGQIAEFHHVFGAIVVEVDEHGKFFFRHLNADDNGLFYDCDRCYGPGWDRPASEFGRPLVTLGDIHVEKLDHAGFASALDMMKVLNPEEVFIHDLIDFENRNHHNLKDPYFLAEQQVLKKSVYGNLQEAVNFLRMLHGQLPDTKFVVIRSNHDQALKRWLQEVDAHYDPNNAWLWHKLNSEVFKAINFKDFDFDVFAYAMEYVAGGNLRRVQFVREDQSYISRDIEHGMHGHRGANGSKGGKARGFRSIGRRTNTGHTHSPEIDGGNYVAGVRGKIDMRYNSGPSSWSAGDILTHPNGKRQLILSRGPKWRA